MAVASSDLPSHAHIEASERETVIRECESAMSWLQEKVDLQAQTAKWDEPVLVSADVIKKQQVLDRVCRPIVTKPAPKPAAPPAPEPAPAAAAGEEAPSPMEAEATAAAEATAEAEAMETA